MSKQEASAEQVGAKPVDIIIASQRDAFFTEVKSLLQGYYLYNLHTIKNTEEVMDQPDGFRPVLAMIDCNGGTMLASEWIQGIKMIHGGCPIIALYSLGDVLDFAILKKNGADYIMHLNYDREFVTDMVLRLAPVDMKGSELPLSALLPIDLLDLESQEQIDFDVYVHLPNNHISLRVRKAGGKFDEHLLAKAAETHQRLYIKKTQIKSYFAYARNILSIRTENSPGAVTEKIYRTKELIHQIISEFLNDDASDFRSGKAIFDRCRDILTELDLRSEKTTEQRVVEVARFSGYSRSIYQDAINMAVFASNFAAFMGLSAEEIECAALAGLLHNVGLAQMPSSTYDKEISEYNAEERQEYEMYPDRSLIMIKAKKVPLPPDTSTAIIQHQENADGSGFPNKLEAQKIDPLGKALRLSMRFLELTALSTQEKGETKIAINGLTPKDALARIKDDAIRGVAVVDLVTATQVFKIFNP